MGNQQTREPSELDSEYDRYLVEKRERAAIYYADKKKRRHERTAKSRQAMITYINDATQREKHYLEAFLADENRIKQQNSGSDNKTAYEVYQDQITEKIRYIKYINSAIEREKPFKEEFESRMRIMKKLHDDMERVYRKAHNMLEDEAHPLFKARRVTP